MKNSLSVILMMFSVAIFPATAGPGHDAHEKSSPADEGTQGHHDTNEKTTSDAHSAGAHHGDGGHEEGHGGGSHANAAGTPVPADARYDQLINVTLLDSMKIEYGEPLRLKPGTTVKFVVTNEGKIAHEFAISNAEEQKAHVEMMRRMPNMKHEDGSTVTVESGGTKVLVWKFDGEREVVFSCNIPGHSEAGMLTQVSIGGDDHPHDH